MLGPMKPPIKNFIHQHRRNRLVSKGARLCAYYLDLYYNRATDDLDANGERWIASHISLLAKPGEKAIVFDVGANVGTYVALLRAGIPRFEAHCFEIVPEVSQALAAALADDSRIIVNDFGLSDRAGDASVTIFPGSSPGSSLAPLPWERFGLSRESRPSRVETGDGYRVARQLPRVDFLKIDTEGHDLAVLRGFRASLEGGLVGAIQFEYGEVSIPSRTLLADFYELLVPLGFRIGRLYPDGVDFKDYNPFEDERFIGGNYIAAHRDQETFIDAVAYRSRPVRDRRRRVAVAPTRET